MKSRYTAANIFEDVKVEKFPRHKFSKSYFNYLTMNHGLAVPFFTKMVIPGDKFDLRTFGRIQLQPLATSTMQNIKCYFRYFYVPFRLLWEDWDKFMTEEPSDTSLQVPFTLLDGETLNRNQAFRPGQLMDYLNYNFYNGENFTYSRNARVAFNLFPLSAYKLIWNKYFRDENLQEEIRYQYFTGPNTVPLGDYALLPVSYSKDYFTSALPWPQKGEPVNLSSLVHLDSSTYDVRNYIKLSDDTEPTVRFYGVGVGTGGGFPVENGQIILPDTAWSVPETVGNSLTSPRRPIYSSVTTDAQELTTSLNINDLRYSNALQKFLERTALGGSRPAEYYLSMYGVHVDDLRIGDPHYLGGGYIDVSVNDIVATANSSIDDVQQPTGTLVGNGKAYPAVKINEPYYCQEFGLIMGIMYIRPELNYMQGLPKEYQLFTKLDFYNPIFAHLGEEAVYKSELCLKSDIVNYPGSPDFNDDVFGYQSRYSYLKHSRNEVHGDFKTTLSSWVLSPMFNPASTELNSDFITVDQSYDIFAVTDSSEHHYLVQLYNQFEVESSMPDFAIPSL